MRHRQRPGFRAATAGIALAGAVGASALGQNATIVIGDPLAEICYEHAAAGLATLATRDDCDRAVESEELLSPRDRAATYVNRSIIRAKLGDPEGAIEDLTHAISMTPDMQGAYLTVGGVYAQLGRWSEAEAALTRGIELNPAEAKASDHFARAAAREELGDIPGAYEDYQTAARLAPDWAAPQTELSRFRIEGAAEDGS